MLLREARALMLISAPLARGLIQWSGCARLLRCNMPSQGLLHAQSIVLVHKLRMYIIAIIIEISEYRAEYSLLFWSSEVVYLWSSHQCPDPAGTCSLLLTIGMK